MIVVAVRVLVGCRCGRQPGLHVEGQRGRAVLL
jgi:hypothetical protein